MDWLYEGLFVKEIPDTKAVGFIYEITHTDKATKSVRKYIGKKSFYSTRNVKKGKRELTGMTDKRGSKKKIVIKESDWRKYQSSNQFLKGCSSEEVEKKMLLLCYTKTELTYQETKALFVHGVLESDEYLNENILGRFYKTE